MALVLKDRVLESSTSTGTGSFTLTGAQTGYQSFSAIGNGNTTYYTIQGKNADGTLTGEWEVGIGTWSTGNTLSRDTVLSNSLGTTAKIVFSAGAKDVFCDYPASKSVNQNADNKVLIPYTSGVTNVGSLNVGDATAHSDSGVIAAFTASEPLYLYTSLQNTSSANTSYASYAVNDGGHTSYGELGINNSNYSYTAAGYPNNTFSAPLATFVESYGGPLAIGTWDSQKISFIVNGSVNTADAMTISAAGNVSTANDITINGINAGRGSGNTSSNTVFGASALGTLGSSLNVNNVAIGANALSIVTSGVNDVGLISGGSGYTDGFYTITLSYLAGTAVTSGGTYPSINVTVSGGSVTSVDSVNNFGSGFTNTTTTFQYIGSALGAGSGFVAGINTLISANNNIAIGYNAGSTAQYNNNCIYIGSGVTSATTAYGETIIGNASTVKTTIRGELNADSYGTVSISNTLTANNSLQLVSNGTSDGNIFTNQNANTLTIGSTAGSGQITLGQANTLAQTIQIGGSTNVVTIGATTGTGTISIGRSTGLQTVNIQTGTTGSGTTVIGGTNATGTITLGRSNAAQTVNIATGINSSATKAVNIGTGSSGGATNIAIGATSGTSITTVNGLLKQNTYTVATLPTGSAGARSFVTNALTPTFGAAVVGGGAVGVPVYHDGTSWKVG